MSRRARYAPLGDDVPGTNVGVGMDESEQEDGRVRAPPLPSSAPPISRLRCQEPLGSGLATPPPKGPWRGALQGVGK